MYDRRQCKKFREDGIHYCTRANGKTLNEVGSALLVTFLHRGSFVCLQ